MAITISIRAKAGQRDLIDQAADRLGRSRSDFVLEAACRQAEDVLLPQTYFALDPKSFAAFRAMLDKPPAPTHRLRRTLKARASWDAASAPDKAPLTSEVTTPALSAPRPLAEGHRVADFDSGDPTRTFG